LLAALAEVAARAPSDIQNMFTYDGTAAENGSTVPVYTVRFYDSSGTAQYVIVDTELPGGGSYYYQPANGVLWVALAEKAYAEANGAGFVITQEVGSNSYAALNYGDAAWAIQAITGNSASGTGIDPDNIALNWNEGSLIVLCTDTPQSSQIVENHCYSLVSYDGTSGEPFQLFNPWGGTTSTDSVPNNPNYYGLFSVDGDFISQNFSGESVGTGAALSVGAHGKVSQRGVDLLLASQRVGFGARATAGT
jgi:hypothetical protein